MFLHHLLTFLIYFKILQFFVVNYCSKTDYKLVYQYDPTMDSKLTSWIYAPYGNQDPNVSPEEIATWDTVTTGKVVLRAYDGGHFFLNDANLAVLFREVEEMVQDF